MPTLRRETLRHGLRTAAASGVGTSRNQAPRDGISTASTALSALRRKHVRRTARGSAGGAGWAAAGGIYGLADGLLPPKQAANGPLPGDDLAATLFCSLDGQAAKTGHRRAASLLRRVGGGTAATAAVGH